MTNPSDPALSIIIPAYNEESRLPRALAKIRDYLASHRSGPAQVEIIIVDDGSVDGTAAVAEKWTREFASLRLVPNGKNHGKGYSVRHGIQEARGRVALFTDADSPLQSRKRTNSLPRLKLAMTWQLDRARLIAH